MTQLRLAHTLCRWFNDNRMKMMQEGRNYDLETDRHFTYSLPNNFVYKSASWTFTMIYFFVNLNFQVQYLSNANGTCYTFLR